MFTVMYFYSFLIAVFTYLICIFFVAAMGMAYSTQKWQLFEINLSCKHRPLYLQNSSPRRYVTDAKNGHFCVVQSLAQIYNCSPFYVLNPIKGSNLQQEASVAKELSLSHLHIFIFVIELFSYSFRYIFYFAHQNLVKLNAQDYLHRTGELFDSAMYLICKHWDLSLQSSEFV